MDKRKEHSIGATLAPDDPLQTALRPPHVSHFPTRIRLTPEGTTTALFAIGRTENDVVVEVERDGKIVGTGPLAGFYNHAPASFARISRETLDTLPE